MDRAQVEMLWEKLVGGYLTHPLYGGHVQRWAELLSVATGCDRDLATRVLTRNDYDHLVDERPSDDEVDDVLDDLLDRLYDVKPLLVCEHVLSAVGPADAVLAEARAIAAGCDELVEVVQTSMFGAGTGRGSDLPPLPPTGEELMQESAPSLFRWRYFG